MPLLLLVFGLQYLAWLAPDGIGRTVVALTGVALLTVGFKAKHGGVAAIGAVVVLLVLADL
jgi:hypothetical protein